MKSGIEPRSWAAGILVCALLLPASAAWSQRQYMGADGLAYVETPPMAYPGGGGGYGPMNYPGQQASAYAPMAQGPVMQTGGEMIDDSYGGDVVPGCPCDACAAACGCAPGGDGLGGWFNVIRQRQPIFIIGEGVFFTRANGWHIQGNPGISSLDFNYPTSIAPKLGVGYELQDGSRIEATYLGYYDNQAMTASLNIPGQPFPTGGFSTLIAGFSSYTNANVLLGTQLQDAEVNYFRDYSSSKLGVLEVMGGARYLLYNEGLEQQFSNTAGSTYLDYQANTQNILLGGQIGAKLNTSFDLWNIETYAKIGAYNNNATQHQTIVGSTGGTFRNTQTNGSKGASVSEAGVIVNYRYSGWLQFRIGFRLLYLDGIAAAINQADYNITVPTNRGGTGLDMNGSSLLYGPVIGATGQF
ncbi:MAG: hypothetical protein JSS27_19695 [Planctomycetes bacterium]|nr:hypothetical protein [Planctomycetota bacterium]